jgi:hypothetical protein
MVAEAGRKLLHDSEAIIDLLEQDAATVGRDAASVESTDDLTAPLDMKTERLLITLCFHETTSLFGRNW